MTDPAPPAQALPRILLADESEISAAAIARHLEGKFEIVHCRDGADAWHLLDNTPAIEVVIIDMQLPRSSARELLTKIRTSTATRLREIPVLAMTGGPDSVAREIAYSGGASDFIGKPIDALELLARVGVHQKLAQTIRDLQLSRQQLQEQATTDALTSLKNRRGFLDLGLRQFALAQRHDSELSVIMLDIDHFKRINDTYGHPAGDEVLVRIAQVLRGKTRVGDVPARVGGEEFAVLLPNTKRTGAALLADRIRVAIQDAEYLLGGRPVGGVTASAGVAAYGLDGENSLEHLVEVADKRLYLAKQRGRNRVVSMS